jgi:hypothetical protein
VNVIQFGAGDPQAGQRLVSDLLGSRALGLGGQLSLVHEVECSARAEGKAGRERKTGDPVFPGWRLSWPLPGRA